jgi:hypothetical protein
MKITKKYLIYILTACTFQTMAGNEDRVGQAGASELLINPWARTAGWGGSNGAVVKGVESFNLNIGGLSFVKGTEIVLSHNEWLKGSDTKVTSAGLARKVGESGALGVSVTSCDFGDIERTTTENPDGGVGNFSIQMINVGLAYSRAFSNSIHGGVVIRFLSEAIADMKSQGMTIDAGIQYVTGNNKDRDNMKFGIALRNVGTPMKYEGEGLAYRSSTDDYTNNLNVLLEQRTQEFEMPSLVNISAAYDIVLAEDHKLTPAVTFTSNSFIRDQFALGAEYAFRDLLMVRGGYTIDKEDKNAIIDDEISSLIGASFGASFQLPLGKSGKYFGVDYGYRATKTFDGTHSFGVRLSL